MESFVFVNGIYVSHGASHNDWIVRCIIKALEPKIERMMAGAEVKLPTSVLENLLLIVDCKQLPVPQFSAQVKQKLTLSAPSMKQIKDNYVIPEASVAKIWDLVKKELGRMLVLKEKDAEKAATKKVHMRKYEEADKYGGDSWLFVPEGDSACKMVRDVIHTASSGLNQKKCGTLNIQGVPLNALKNVREIEMADGTTYLSKKKALRDNIGLQCIVQAIGLSWDKDYYYGPPMSHPKINELTDAEFLALEAKVTQGDEDFAALNYGALIMATDQDLDGVGQICSLIMVFIHTFWPELIKRGFLRRISTPVIRAYPPATSHQYAHLYGGSVKNFFSETEFNAWVTQNFGSMAEIPAALAKDIHYYKGLASHSAEEVNDDIAPDFMSNIYTFTTDDFSAANIQAFYGPETAARKQILQTPVTTRYNEAAFAHRRISCSDHLNIEAKTFQLEFMRRKLKHGVDGFVPSQRKAFASARVFFRQHTQAKVYILTADVNKRMHYPYGDTSMNDAIIKMAQSYTGTNIIPPLSAISNGFGDRHTSRDDTGHPRYINVGYNAPIMNVLYPPEDDWLLRYEFEEGVQCEPVFYVPILPYSIMETYTTAAVGWKICLYSRDIGAIIAAVRQVITNDDDSAACSPPIVANLPPHVPPGMRVVEGRFRTGKITSEICIGSYKIVKNNLVVTQLPFKIWSYDYKCSLLGINPATGKPKEATKATKMSAAAKQEADLKAESKAEKKRIKREAMLDTETDEQKAAREASEAEEPGRTAAIARARTGPSPYVSKIADHTALDVNNIQITLKPGALDAIRAKDSPWGNEFIDPIEDYFDLALQMAPQLNLITEKGVVKEYQTYEQILSDWYPKRRELYKKRLMLQIVLKELEVLFYENQLRFCVEDAAKIINIDKDLSDAERESALLAANYQTFHKTRLFTSQYVADVSDVADSITNSARGASYQYIDNITKKMQSRVGMTEQQVTLDKPGPNLRPCENKHGSRYGWPK
jgi:hypothetical protein